MSRDQKPNELRDTAAFYERLGSEADVQLEPGYNQDEVFDDQFERRASEIQRTPGSAVSVIPSKKGPWSGNNQLGIERAFAPDADNRQTILRLDEWGFPEQWTLCLGLTYDAAAYDGLDFSGTFSVTAEVEFGTGGVTQYLELDWLQGASIALPMNALNVVAHYSTVDTEAGVTIPPPDLRLRANVVRGNLTQAHPTRSFILGFDEGIQSCPVPPFARSVRLQPNSGAFSFFQQDFDVDWVGTLTNAFAIAASNRRSQFTEYLDFVQSRAGAPVYVDVPSGARFLVPKRLDVGVDTLTAQFLLGV